MSVYAISDIHGCYSMFLRMLDKIEFDETKDTLYIVGDIMDRGPEIPEMVRWVWEHESDHVIMLKGNHEDMFASYPDPDYYAYYFRRFSTSEIQRLLQWIPSLPSFIEVTVNNTDYILVHAGITQEILKTGKDPNDYCIWAREEFYNGTGIPGKTIVFGHTPMMSWMIDQEMSVHIWRPKDPSIHLIGIDTGAVFAKSAGGRLSCLRLDDQKEFYIYAQ
jgi:serine/threonine protein phosphatase 1